MTLIVETVAVRQPFVLPAALQQIANPVATHFCFARDSKSRHTQQPQRTRAHPHTQPGSSNLQRILATAARTQPAHHPPGFTRPVGNVRACHVAAPALSPFSARSSDPARRRDSDRAKVGAAAVRTATHVLQRRTG